MADPKPEASAAASPAPADIQLDYVGSVDNAATMIAALHRGEKRLVFCESRRLVEELGEKLRAKGVTTCLSHASSPSTNAVARNRPSPRPVIA